MTVASRPGQLAWLPAAKAVLFVICLVPFLRLFWLGYNDGLGTNPVEFVTRSTGTWTLVMLCVTLGVTPLRRFTGWNWLVRLRRMFGLYAFFYACAHFTTYIWFDQWFSITDIAKDIIKRPFITIGFAAFLMLVPLAITSTDAMIRRLGRRWQVLHRLVYVVATFGVVHYIWLKSSKNNLGEPLIYAAVVAVLLLLRVFWQIRTRIANTQRGNIRSKA